MNTLAALLCLVAADDGRFPFHIPADRPLAGAADMAWLNRPCDERGFCRIEDGHFVLPSAGAEDGGDAERFRVWGFNLTFGACFPSKEDAPKIAAHLASLGCNAVRFHHIDMQDFPQGVWRRLEDGRREFHPEAVDRLDFFAAELHKRGVYANYNLHVSRTLSPAEGLPRWPSDLPWYASFNKYVTYFDPRVQQAVKDYCRELLTHENPYRGGRRRTDDPGTAFLEMLNENSFSEKGAGQLDQFPPVFRAEFRRQWNEWLWRKYANDGRLRAAWSEGNTAGETLIDSAAWGRKELGDWRLDGGLKPVFVPAAEDVGPRLAVVTTETSPNHRLKLAHAPVSLKKGRTYTLSLKLWSHAPRQGYLSVSTNDPGEWTPVGPAESVAFGPGWTEVTRIFEAGLNTDAADVGLTLGDAAGRVEVADVTLIEGVRAEPLPEEQSIVERSVEIPGATAGAVAAADLRAFMEETEIAWTTELRRFLREECGAKVPVCASQVNYHGARLAAEAGDFIDLHTYWNHPLGDPFGSGDWWLKDAPMEPSPLIDQWPTNSLVVRTGWRVRGMPLTLSEWNYGEPGRYAASGVLVPAVIQSLQDWDGTYFFQYDDAAAANDGPFREADTGFFSFNARPHKLAMFAALAPLVRRPDLAALEGEVAGSADDRSGGTVALRKRVVIDLDRTSAEPSDNVGRVGEAGRMESPGGAVVWDSGEGFITVNTPRTRAVSGLIASREFTLGSLLVKVGQTPEDYAAVVLTSVDGQPLESSGRMLLVAAHSSENTGFEWNEDKTRVLDWGGPPTRTAAVPLTVTLAGQPLEVHALNGSGERDHAVEVEEGTFRVRPGDRTIWYELNRP